jgi:hypothetical protein
MAKRKDKVPPTTEPKQQQEPMIMAPVEVQFHVANFNVSKYETGQGGLTVVELISPIGVAVTVKLSDENVDELVKGLQGSKVEVFKSLPGLTP